MKKFLSVIAVLASLSLAVVSQAAPQGGAASLHGGAKIASPGVKFLPCTSGCPTFKWNAVFTPAFAQGGATGWGGTNPAAPTTPGQLVAASCGGNVHTSTMSVGGVDVDYQAVCVGLLCVGGGTWGAAGVLEAQLVFSVPFNEAAQCLNGIVGTGPGFQSATFDGGAAGATN